MSAEVELVRAFTDGNGWSTASESPGRDFASILQYPEQFVTNA
jgi:hypothetical protein